MLLYHFIQFLKNRNKKTTGEIPYNEHRTYEDTMKKNTSKKTKPQIIKKEVLQQFSTEVFVHYGIRKKDAKICSDVLIAADLRGINSHGVDSLTRYIAGIKEGIIIPKNSPEIIAEEKTSILVDGHGAMGMVSGEYIINTLIKKSKRYGIAIGTVRESNHFGFGGYYAMKASQQNMLGLVLTNTAAIAVPTFATRAMIGSNAISFAAPAGAIDFVLDMATTIVPRGLLKRYADEGRPIPEGWFVNDKGEYVVEADEVLKMLCNNTGGLVPLGGKDTSLGGHKGYGLGLMVDILTGTLSGFKNSYQIHDTAQAAGRSSQTFIVINISFFRNIDEFKNDMDNLLSALISTPAVEGKQVIVHGQGSYEKQKHQTKHGISIASSTYQSLVKIGNELGIRLG